MLTIPLPPTPRCKPSMLKRAMNRRAIQCCHIKYIPTDNQGWLSWASTKMFFPAKGGNPGVCCPNGHLLTPTIVTGEAYWTCDDDVDPQGCKLPIITSKFVQNIAAGRPVTHLQKASTT